ncbi:VIT domain-containing protein [Nonomuraea sp. NPDC050663]|uniref:VIT domain-containing protein n=1 Tax=Nonomuraea sp. NPDC050663 TaxID=3364370 RepID=UPI003788AF14
MKITSLDPTLCRPLEDSGFGALKTEQGNLPLESLDVKASVTGLIAGVEVAQGFRNPFDVSLEATYVFPLPDRAAVTGFRMEADDRVIEGVLKERGQARADYAKAVREGRRAALAEEDRPDVFTITVGNIVPGERVTVRLTLSQPLPYEDGAATFRFPLVVAPRYIPGAPLDGEQAGPGAYPDTDQVPDASRITPPVLLPGFPNPVRLSLSATVDAAGLELTELASSLHVVEQEGTTVSVRPGERLDRDFILRLGFAASTSLQVDEGGAFSLTVVPPAVPEGRVPRDVVLLLDRSGSMGGWKMVAARRAAARIVDTLTAADRFAVLAFDSVVEPAFDGLREASDRHRFRAVEHLSRVEARGGTELLDPLRQAVSLLGEPGRERVVVLVTDGQVGNEDHILEQVGGALSAMRVHVVGIDRAVNAGFLGRLAGLGAGRCELVESEDRLDAAMEQIHRRIGAPLVTDLTLKGPGLEEVTHLGSIFPGVPLQVFGRYSGDGPVTVHGLAAGSPWEQSVAPVTVANPALPALWARARLRELEDRYAMGEHALEPRIVRLSLDHGVLCRFTAYIAVDNRVVAEGGPQHQVIQPVELPSGWEMPVAAAAPMMAAAMPMPKPASRSFAPAVYSAQEAELDLPDFLTGGAPGGAPARGPAAPGAPAHGPAAPGGPGGSGGSGGSGGPAAPPPPPAARGRGFAKRAMRPAPAPADHVRAQLAAELARLREVRADRGLYLADLASRLSALAAFLGGHAELEALAGELEPADRPGADVDALWQRAVDALTRLTDGPEETPERKPFWKRG